MFTENICLSKELSGLQSELERLRSHNASSQDLIAEKQELQRQLNMLEVQLKDEKRAHERTQTHDIQQDQEIARLSLQLEKTHKELAESVKTKEQYECNAQQQRLEWTTQRNALDTKIEMLNKKLRSTNDQRQVSHAQHRWGNSNITTYETNQSGPRPRAIPLQRPTAQFNQDMAIATPGAVQTHEKAKRSKTALPGDKSVFSITPYLSRANGQPDFLTSSEDYMNELGAFNEEDIDMSPLESVNLGKSTSVDSQVDSQTITAKDLPRKTMKQKSNIRQPMPARLQAKEGLAKQSSQIDSDDQLEDLSGIHAQTIGHGPAKPKKRKLGAQRDRTLFDEDEDDELHEYKKPGRKLAHGIGRDPVLSGFQPPSAPTGNLSNQNASGLQAFSPLKRDKKKL